MRKTHSPPDMIPVVGPLSWGLEVAPANRWLLVSGQVGADANGHVPDGLLAQTRLVWSNIDHVLKSAGMSARHIVRTGIFLTSQVPFTEEERKAFNELRIGFLGENRPASTLLFVHRLMDPRWLVEIDAFAVDDTHQGP
jgi:enamine deaminase RidA (YjgF/YER057c/UK114 family)